MQFLIFVLAFAISLAFQLVLAEAPPRKLVSEGHRQIIFAHVNESVTLKCPVETSPEYKTFVDWTRGNMSLYMTVGYEITPKGYLKIKSVANHHSGIYTCEAINGYGVVRVNLTLVVDNPEVQNRNNTIPNRNSANKFHSYAPSITQRPSSLSAEAGGEATFHCIASGQPLPHLFWLKDGHLIQGASSYVAKRRTHSTLKLKGLQKADAGDYKCIARNMLGEDDIDFVLHVSEPSPPPRIIALDPPNVTIREGSPITFVCQVASRPGVQLHVKWLKRHEEISESIDEKDFNLFRSGRMYYRPLNVTDNELVTNGGIYKSKLLIRNTGEADSGTYVCLALNDKGFNFKNSTLKVIGRSKTLANTSHFSTSSTSLAVTITVTFVVLLAAVVFISHLCCRSKSEDKTRMERASIPNVEAGTLKQSTASVRKTNNEDQSRFPVIGDPQSTSKLLGIDSTFLYEHSESQTSKSIQERKSFL